LYFLLWKFRPKKGLEENFEKAYGPEGDWVRLFRKGRGYVRTELYSNGNGTYITVDEWDSREAFEEFKAKFRHEYQILDKKLQSLTDEETFIGSSAKSNPDEIY
jgi:heme-degrading monooxygenase HmoA